MSFEDILLSLSVITGVIAFLISIGFLVISYIRWKEYREEATREKVAPQET